MSKNKLEKFAELDALSNTLQYPYQALAKGKTFPHRGRWGEAVFGNNHPIVLELGCGKGEYTVALARRYPEMNFVGVDIKGSRIWTGATTADREGLENVRFLRTQIELIGTFFDDGEVAEIWLTFPDPQMKKVRKRLTSLRFLQEYHRILMPDGLLHLKTDSGFLYRYTQEISRANSQEILQDFSDIYSNADAPAVLREVQTYYEQQWLSRGMTIKYLCIRTDDRILQGIEPDVEIEPDSYRSYGRSRRIQQETTATK